MPRALVLVVFVLMVGCEPNTEAVCHDWATASCPPERPNLSLGVSEEACNSNFRFACRSENCDVEHEAMILCETDHPTCCNEDGCDNAAHEICTPEREAWWDCTERLRDACRG